jgi:hypothetical protein
LSRKRDVNAAKAFLRKTMKGQRIPTKITLKAYAASHLGSSNGCAQCWFLKIVRTAAIVIGGIALAEKIKKGQFKVGKLGGRTAKMPEIWQAALAA